MQPHPGRGAHDRYKDVGLALPTSYEPRPLLELDGPELLSPPLERCGREVSGQLILLTDLELADVRGTAATGLVGVNGVTRVVTNSICIRDVHNFYLVVLRVALVEVTRGL